MLAPRPVTDGMTALAVLLSVTAVVTAQQRYEESVLVTATAAPIAFENLARTVTVLTREQIASLPARSVAELLRYVASVEVKARGALGVQSDFAVRGAGFGQTLVLVNGLRINDAQTGHHNGDIPVALDDIERIEILHGPGSSLYGADAFGGTINVITRNRGRTTRASIAGGEYGLVDAMLGTGLERGTFRQSVSLSTNRSSGFMFDRDVETLNVTTQTAVGAKTSVLASHLRRTFGANGFYGPSPSKEWTNQTLLSIERRETLGDHWSLIGQTSYRTHGDRFLWDVGQPGLFENRHRTHAVGLVGKAQRVWSGRTRLSFGTDVGGDWLRSSNLGDRAYARGSLFVELERHIGPRTVLYPGVRYDTYSGFGSALSPSLSASTWLGSTVRLRSSAGRAFRVPTFTERYYRDPNHEASSALEPEHAWTAEAGVDWLLRSGWMTSATGFARWERDVIDWIRESTDQKWRTANIRRITAGGLELAARRSWSGRHLLDLQYTYLDLDAGTPAFLSKYVLDYARHSVGVAAFARLAAGLSVGQRIDYKRRADGRHYWVLDSRLSRQWGKAAVYVECSNLLNTAYQEILGVDMPPRWVRVGLQVPTY